MCGSNLERTTTLEISHVVTSAEQDNPKGLLELGSLPKPSPLQLSSNDLYIMKVEYAYLESVASVPCTAQIEGLYAPYLFKVNQGKMDYNKAPSIFFSKDGSHPNSTTIVASPFDKQLKLQFDIAMMFLDLNEPIIAKINFTPVDELESMKKY